MAAGLWILMVLLFSHKFFSSDSGAALDKEKYRLRHKIYTDLRNNSQCFRLLNGTHQIGCQSSRFGDTGVVHIVEEYSDVTWILEDKGRHAPYIPVLTFKAWTTEDPTERIVQGLRESHKVAGMIVIFQAEQDIKPIPVRDEGYSPDDSCPNSKAGYKDNSGYCRYPWNKFGESGWFQDWGFPVFLVERPEEIEAIINCYWMYNHPVEGVPASYPLCAATLHLWMLASTDAPTCLRRGKLFDGVEFVGSRGSICSPLSGNNVFNIIPNLAIKPKELTKQTLPAYKANSTFILATRMDSFSMFSDVAPGAESACSSLISLLAVAHALGQDRDRYDKLKKSAKERGKHLLLAFFNGESLGYIGSSRMIYDMEKGVFPFEKSPDSEKLRLKHMGLFMELNQLALARKGRYYAYVDSPAYKANQTMIDEMLEFMKDHVDDKWRKIDLVEHGSSSVLPSSSYQRFLRKKPKLPGIVVTDFPPHQFNSRFYNGFGDRQNQFGSSDVEDLLFVAKSSLAAALWWLGETKVDDFKIDEDLVRELYDCLIGGDPTECRLYKEALDSDVDSKGELIPPRSNLFRDLKSKPHMMTYIGPSGYYSAAHFITNYMVREVFSVNTTKSKEKCATSNKELDDFTTYFWLRKNVCAKSDAFLKEAESPAFQIEDYEQWESSEYSTWVESVFFYTEARGSNHLKLFLLPHPLWEWLVFGVGSILTLVSFLITFYVNDRWKNQHHFHMDGPLSESNLSSSQHSS